MMKYSALRSRLALSMPNRHSPLAYTALFGELMYFGAFGLFPM